MNIKDPESIFDEEQLYFNGLLSQRKKRPQTARYGKLKTPSTNRHSIVNINTLSHKSNYTGSMVQKSHKNGDSIKTFCKV